jgi:AcrR family transcriptional regulator
MREIAASAGVSVGTITYHFEGISEILVEVLRFASERFTNRLLDQVANRRNAMDGLQLLIDAVFPDEPDSVAQWRLWLAYWSEAARDPALQVVPSERYEIWRSTVEQLIEEGVRGGEFQRVSSQEVATEFIGLFDGLAIQASIGDKQLDVKKAKRVLRKTLESRLMASPAESASARPG